MKESVKRLTVLLGTLALMLAVVGVPSALAQGSSQYAPAGEFIATGVLEDAAEHAPDPTPTYAIIDEASGALYELQSGFVDLEFYVGERVNVYGMPAPGVGTPPIFDVTRIESAPPLADEANPCDELLPSGEPNPDHDPALSECQAPGDGVTVTFELTVEGEIPEGKLLGVDTGIQDISHPVFCSTTTYHSSLPRCEDGATYSDTFEWHADQRLSYEYTVFDQNYGGVVETFAADTRTFTQDETVSATYRVGDPDNKVTIFQATGKLEKPEVTSYMYGSHTITDEASGTFYALQSSIVDLGAYVGQRVTLYGALVPGYENGQIEGGPPLVDVYQIVPAGGPDYETVTATFELTVEGEPPAEDTVDGWSPFQGSVGSPSESYGMLLDQDGDGVYTAEWPVKKGVEAPVDISYINAGGELVRVIDDFGLVSFEEDKTFSASISFDGSEPPAPPLGGTTTSPVDGSATGLRALPATGGGALTLIGSGALLIAVGLLARRATR